jgi:CRISPR-associated protein Csb2
MLAVDVTWLGGSYEAGILGEKAEWPPHPARLFCALVAAAGDSHSHELALRWLEAAGMPSVICSPATVGTRRAFVPVNSLAGTDSHAVYPARRAALRTWPYAVPRVGTARFVWPSSPHRQIVEALTVLCRRVPYLGRAVSPALIDVVVGDDLDQAGDGIDVWVPDAAGKVLLRVPEPGYLDRLRAVWDEGGTAHEVPCGYPYRVRTAQGEPAAAATAEGPWPEMATLSVSPDGPWVDGRHIVAITSALKALLLRRLGERGDGFPQDRLVALHGHQTGGRRQAAFLALPWVGHKHATGRVLAVGVALPGDLDAELRLALSVLLVDTPGGASSRPAIGELFVPGVGTLRLGGRSTVTAQVRRWVGPASTWVSVTPVVADRFARRGYTVAESVADSCVLAGLPEPGDVETFQVSPVRGCQPARAVRRRPDAELRPSTHSTIRFRTPVRGPVVLGHLRHLGLGLCLPAESC